MINTQLPEMRLAQPGPDTGSGSNSKSKQNKKILIERNEIENNNKFSIVKVPSSY